MPIDPRAVESEILAGLRNEAKRLDRARQNFDFYNCDFERYPVRYNHGDLEQCRYRRSSPLMRRVVHVLAEHLYRQGPQRVVADNPGATEWLADTYKANALDSVMQQADRYACVGDVALVQWAGTDDPERPVRAQLWGADQFVVWIDPEDPVCAGAIGTIDMFDNQRRLRLYTPDEVTTFLTDRLRAEQTAGGTAYRLADREPNPYGCLPFASIHFDEPAAYFWSGGPGDVLCEANDYLNFRLTETGDNLRFYGRPIGVAEGVSAAWRPPTPLRPGQFISVPASGVDAAGVGPAPSLHYLQADLHAVTTEWTDLGNFIDHILEMLGVPPATIRMEQNTSRSGVSIVAEQLPLIVWAVGRQRSFARYEAQLARACLKVGGVHEGRADLTNAAGEGFDLTLKWPEMVVDVPGMEKDRADEFELSVGLISKIQLIMQRKKLTRDEAVAYLEQLAEDSKLETTLLPSEAVAPPPPATTIGTKLQ